MFAVIIAGRLVSDNKRKYEILTKMFIKLKLSYYLFLVLLYNHIYTCKFLTKVLITLYVSGLPHVHSLNRNVC